MKKFVFKEHSPIGHFISEKGKENFYTAYDEAMALLPSPKETKDIETEYGFVRVYLFTKEKNKDKDLFYYYRGVLHQHLCGNQIWKD